MPCPNAKTMRTSRIFIKIFLSFWLAMVLAGAVVAAVLLTTNPRAAYLAHFEKQIAGSGSRLIDIYQTQGAPALWQASRQITSRTRARIFLFKGNQLVSQGFVPPVGMELAAMAVVTRRPQQGPHGWFAYPVKGGFTVLAKPPPPSRLWIILNPGLIGLRLIVTFIVGGVVSYLLARSLVAPLMRLQIAARRFAAGELGTRVGPELGNRKDEIAGLGKDFDRMAERIEALVRAQKRLLRDISHELRSPLARLNVALELARRNSAGPALKALDRMENESNRLNGLIGQLADLTWLESGAATVPKARIDLARLVQAIVEDANFEAMVRNRSVEFTPPEKEMAVEGSEELLRRAVENVVRNAVRYTDAGTAVEVALLLRKTETGADYIVRVRDHGPGVPDEALTQLFQPFYRVDGARDRLTGGTGIGLAITEWAVHLHGGNASAFNEPSGGLVMEIALPAA